ncbi:MAG: YibE/F family protein [Oscillospiraceae bacterium]
MKEFIEKNKWTVVILLAAAVIFIAARICLAPSSDESSGNEAAEFAEYDTGTVIEILSDSTEQDEASDGAYRGDQLMLVKMTSGRYKGETLQVYNFVGPLYGAPLKAGDSAVLIVSTYADGSHNATVYEYNRTLALAAVIALFIIATVLVGGKTGAKSLIGLIITLICLFWLLLPMLMKGFPTLLTVFLICTYVTIVSFTILGGVSKKTVCASLSTVCGIAIALVFALSAQGLARIDGLRLADVEPLLQLRQTGTPIGLRYLLVGGIVISALGAVMDVAMSIASALSEIHLVDPKLGTKDLFRSGMNIGRDMVGTMTNTLILAFIGSSFVVVIYLYSIGLQPYQLLSSSYLAIEVISGISSSIGVILSVPITAFISAYIISGKSSSKKTT